MINIHNIFLGMIVIYDCTHYMVTRITYVPSIDILRFAARHDCTLYETVHHPHLATTDLIEVCEAFRATEHELDIIRMIAIRLVDINHHEQWITAAELSTWGELTSIIAVKDLAIRYNLYQLHYNVARGDMDDLL